AQAIAARTYDREAGLIRFRCEGAPAAAFFDALAGWSAGGGGMEITADGATWRLTAPIEENLFGRDYCRRDAAGATQCTAVFNAGDFIKP
ncbi:MAG: hypothetical protein NW200_14500, partial [Hyphomonadaceae bacterium]|nr:hypothetical protein [Hyphomonadaceae bacterium]